MTRLRPLLPRLLLPALLGSLLGVPSLRAEEEDASLARWARGEIRRRAGRGDPAPEFPSDAAWLNVSRPLTLHGDLRGKVVLLDFWCYCCINCLHVLPDLEHLERTFAGEAFAVVGVHSAKFPNEKGTANIREAVLRHEIEHPVVNDADFRVWNAYGARAWPTLVLLGADGRPLGSVSGEGHRDTLEALVKAALGHYEAEGMLDASPLPLRLERLTRPVGDLAYPGAVAVDPFRKSLFVADSNHHRVVELGLDGAFRRAWGDGEPGLVDGGGPKARFFRPQGLTLAGSNLWVADTANHAIRHLDLNTGLVRTVAGTGRQGYAREGEWPALEADLSSPWDVLRAGDRLFVAMAGLHQIWVLDLREGRIGPFAGDGTERRKDARRLENAAFAQPSGLAFDGRWIYVADSESSSVVRVGLQGPVETIAGASGEPRDLFHFGDEDGRGAGRRFQHPLGLALHDGLLYVADTYNHKVKTLDPETGEVRSRWGTGAPGFADAPPAFREPSGLAVHEGRLYVADTNNHAIRVIDLAQGVVTTLPLVGVPIPQAAARRGGAGEDWPEIAGTVRRALEPQEAPAGAAFRLEVRLDLPEGWHLTEGAPSRLRVEGAGAVVDAPLEALATVLVLEALPPGAEARLVVRLLYYVCRDEGTCRVRSAVLALPLVPRPGAPGGTVVATDRFDP